MAPTTAGLPGMKHECAGESARSLFCADCGKLLDRDGLKAVKLQGFHGAASLSPAIERMWETGDPAGV